MAHLHTGGCLCTLPCWMNIKSYSTVWVFDVWCCALKSLRACPLYFSPFHQRVTLFKIHLAEYIFKERQPNNTHSKQCRDCVETFFFFFLQIDTNTQDTDTKTLTAERWPCGPAFNCTSCGRRSTNKYTHATVTNIYQMECTKTPKSCLWKQ